MKVQCHVLTTPASDTLGTCLLLHFDDKRYLIGHIGEGAQRALTERRARLMKVTDIFLSGRTQWSNTGGLVGLLLSMGDQEEGRVADSLAMVGRGKKGQRGITVHGGENLVHTLATTRAFVFRKAMKLKINEIPKPALGQNVEIPYFKDGNIVVRPLHIHPDGCVPTEVIAVGSPARKNPLGRGITRKRSFNDISDSDRTREAILNSVVENMFCSDWTMNTMLPGTYPLNENDMLADLPSSQTKRPRSTERDPQLSPHLPPPGKSRAPWPASTVQTLPRSTPSPIALSYIVTLHPQRGRFLPKKAIALGVQSGPNFARLTAGETLTLPNGTIVTPGDVLEPTRPGTGFAVVDLPDVSYIAGFLSQPEWADVPRVATEIGAFFYILGLGVAADPRIQTFVTAHSHASHIVSSVDICPDTITFKGAATAATKLNLMDRTYFPLPHASNEFPPSPLSGIEPALPGLAWQIEPKWELQRKRVEPLFNAEQALAGVEPEYAQLAKETRERNDVMMARETTTGGWGDIELITLGTGSALPSKYRNVSSTLLRVPGAGSVLFDCGENTLGQLKRLYAKSELREVWRDLRAVYISHLHADHHLGTVAVLRAWHEEVNGRIPSTTVTEDETIANEDECQISGGVMNVIAPRRFLTWLQEYADVENYGFSHIRFVSCEDIAQARPNTVVPKLSDVLDSLSLESIRTSPAAHCQGSFTTAWTWTNSFKFAYSGDTRPTRGFVEIGNGATILLHEATFDDELIAEAVSKRHSTTSEALKAGRDMGARGVVLTHFSQRYPKLPVLSGSVEEGMEVVLAFDFCRVRVGDMGRFEGFLPALMELYKDEEGAEKDEEWEEMDEEERAEVKKLKSKEHKMQQRQQKQLNQQKRSKKEKREEKAQPEAGV